MVRALLALLAVGCTCADAPVEPVAAPAPAPVVVEPVAPIRIEAADGPRGGAMGARGERGDADPWDRRLEVYRFPLGDTDPDAVIPKLRAAFPELGADAFAHDDCTSIQVYDTEGGTLAAGHRSLRRTTTHAAQGCAPGGDDRTLTAAAFTVAGEAEAQALLGDLAVAQGDPPAFRTRVEEHGATFLVHAHVPARGAAGATTLSAADGALLAFMLGDATATARCAAPVQVEAWAGGKGGDDGDDDGAKKGRGRLDRSLAPLRRMRLVSYALPGKAPRATEIVLGVPARILSTGRGAEGPELIRERLEGAGLLAAGAPVDLEAWIDGCGK